MARYHFNADETLSRLSPKELGLVYTSVQRIELDGEVTLETKMEEMCIACIEGSITYKCGEMEGEAEFKDMLYMGRNSLLKMHSIKPATLICFSAPSCVDTQFSHIKFADVDADKSKHFTYGNTGVNTRRDVWNFIDSKFTSSRFLVGICQGDCGGWTAWPPHEHGDKREEVYAYFDMGPSFSIQCVYEDFDKPLTVSIVRDGDVVSIPKGYHPNVACPAGKLSYIFCMVSKKPGDRNFMDLNIQKMFGSKFE